MTGEGGREGGKEKGLRRNRTASGGERKRICRERGHDIRGDDKGRREGGM